MKGYICTYRNFRPPTRARERTLADAEQTNDEDLKAFLRDYDGSYLDWGDDPSFFASRRFVGDVRRSSWGVCRRDVRDVMEEGDVVVFFCAKQSGRTWDYYYIGCGTVGACVTRAQVWNRPAFAEYRRFYNLLARTRGRSKKLVQHETFHPKHADWKKRCSAHYIIFDPALSFFELEKPVRVARWKSGAKETWLKEKKANALQELLFRERGITRRLRSKSPFRPHPKLNLKARAGARAARSLPDLRDALRGFASPVAVRKRGASMSAGSRTVKVNRR